MGVRPSKVVITKVSKACSDAVGSGKDKIEVDLCDSEFLETLKELWSNLPERTQKYITGEAEPDRRRKLPRQSHSTFTLDACLLDRMPLWKMKPLLFFNEGKTQLTLSEDPLSELNTYMTQLYHRKGLSVVRFRLIQVIYHRLKEERLCVKQLRSKDVQRLARITSHSGLSGDPGISEPPVAEWVGQGRRINELCRALGSVRKVGYSHLANLFFLQDVSDTTIKKIPMQQKGRENALQVLKARNQLCTEDRRSLEELADYVVQTLWRKVENSITNSDLGWELRQTQSFRVHDTIHPIEGDTPTSNLSVATGQEGNSASEDVVLGAEIATDLSTDAASFERTCSRPLRGSLDRSEMDLVDNDIPRGGQFYNMGTDAFNMVLNAPHQSSQSDVPPAPLDASDNANPFLPLVHSDGSAASVDWDGQFYNMGTDAFNMVFSAPHESWNAPPLVQSNAPPAPLSVLDVPDGQDMGLAGNQAERAFDRIVSAA